VFEAPCRKEALSRHGLAAYAQHPLLRTVSLDRSFYRPVPRQEYEELAAQVPEDFRFIVKAWSGVTDAALRTDGTGAPTGLNPGFLDPALASSHVVVPAADGLGARLGAIVFQMSPLPAEWRGEPSRWLDQLGRFFARIERPAHGALALEVRDAALLTPQLAALLKAEGVRYCLGLHDRMPSIDAQLPMLRAVWPGPLVCRWSLQRGLRYGQAKGLFEPFDRLAAPDPTTRRALAHLAVATARAGHDVLIAINNKAEGSAPLSVHALAEEIGAQQAAAPQA
jgi:uncharacterized protein YecE (DUF72 family)